LSWKNTWLDEPPENGVSVRPGRSKLLLPPPDRRCPDTVSVTVCPRSTVVGLTEVMTGDTPTDTVPEVTT